MRMMKVRLRNLNIYVIHRILEAKVEQWLIKHITLKIRTVYKKNNAKKNYYSKIDIIEK